MINWDLYKKDLFLQNGYVSLGNMADLPIFHDIEKRIDDIMMGRAALNYQALMMQLDSTTGAYEDAGAMTLGFKGPTLAYRKIENLEWDQLFRQLITLELFQEICVSVYGEEVPISTFRTMFMNKPAGQGTFLPWHQDRWNFLNKDPVITLYLAIDAATPENGCVRVIPKSHHLGLLNPDHTSGFLNEENVQKYCPEEKHVYLNMKQGDLYLLHNQLIHGSEKNHSKNSRRALSICYMDAHTQNLKKGKPHNEDILFVTKQKNTLATACNQ